MTKEQTKQYIESYSLPWSDFLLWMADKTSYFNEFNEPCYYGHDIELYIYVKKLNILT